MYVGCSISCGSSTLPVKLVLQTRHICEHFELISLSSKFHQDRFGSLVTTIFQSCQVAWDNKIDDENFLRNNFLQLSS